eukprot:1865343-Pleurochrysis_carterae.AAC.3
MGGGGGRIGAALALRAAHCGCTARRAYHTLARARSHHAPAHARAYASTLVALRACVFGPCEPKPAHVASRGSGSGCLGQGASGALRNIRAMPRLREAGGCERCERIDSDRLTGWCGKSGGWE